MKVSFLMGSVSRNGGGVTDAALFLSHSLANHGVDMSVHGLGDHDAGSDVHRWQPLSPVVHQTRWENFLGYAPTYYKGLCKTSPDIAHCHVLWKYPSVACQRWAAGNSARRYLISPHGMLDKWALSRSPWKKRAARIAFQTQHLKKAACIHALCEAELNAIRAYGLTNPVCVIPNGVHIPANSPTLPPPWESQIPAESPVMLFLGRIHPKKGLVNLLQAWNKMGSSEASTWHLVIAGWDQLNHKQELMGLRDELGLSNIHFVGPLFGEEKEASFRRANAFVLPSLSEGLPVSVLEAWSYEKPVLMTHECNIPEATAAEAGIVVDVDVDSLAEGMRLLLSMAEKDRMKIGRNGRTLVESRFTWNQVGNEMKAVYNWVANGGELPPSVVL